MSNRRDRPAAKRAYQTHFLGGIAILSLDSTEHPRVPRLFGKGTKVTLSSNLPSKCGGGELSGAGRQASLRRCLVKGGKRGRSIVRSSDTALGSVLGLREDKAGVLIDANEFCCSSLPRQVLCCNNEIQVFRGNISFKLSWDATPRRYEWSLFQVIYSRFRMYPNT